MQSLPSCAGVQSCRNTRNSNATPADRGDCLKARTRKEIFTVETSTGAADQYFRTGPPGAQALQPGRSLPLSHGCRLTLLDVVSEKYRSPPAAEFACRSTADASSARRHRRRAARVQGVRMPCSWIADPHGDIADDPPAADYGRVRFLCDESHENRQRAKKRESRLSAGLSIRRD